MNYLKLVKLAFVVVLCVGVLSACQQRCICETNPIPGTDTAMVIISIGEDGKPQVNVEVLDVYPGQRVVFVGPEAFTLVYREEFPYVRSEAEKKSAASDNKSEAEVSTDDGVINFTVLEEYRDTIEDGETLLIKYDVIVAGVPLDPYVRIHPK